MPLTTGQAIAAIAVMSVVTFLTRALPFLLFDRGGTPPKVVLYLGRVLPPAVIAMLIIYCLRNISSSTACGTSASAGAPTWPPSPAGHLSSFPPPWSWPSTSGGTTTS